MIMVAYCSMLIVPAAFLAGLLRSRLARGGLAQLFRELGGMRGAALQAALGRTLGDPTLVLAYRLPGSRGYVDAEGAPGARAAGHARAGVRDDRARRPRGRGARLRRGARRRPGDGRGGPRRRRDGAGNERLLAESEARLAEVQASRQRIVAAGDAERRRLERDLHDGAQQRLVSIALQLRLIRSGIRSDPGGRGGAGDARPATSSARSLEELRELARGIHPAALDHGLVAALESLATRSTVTTAVVCDAPEACRGRSSSPSTSSPARRWPTSASTPAATAASVRLSRTAGRLAIEIADDGVGGADAARGSGLRGLADRVAALDGRLRVTSPPGAGTVVAAELPCGS